jgi:hypothetical protein
MTAADLDELERILAGFSVTDIAQMKPKERPPTSLKKVKKLLDRTRPDQLSLIFRGDLTKPAIWQILTFLHEHDRALFDLLFLLLDSLPNRVETLPSAMRPPNVHPTGTTRNIWELLAVHPLFRFPADCRDFHFEPMILNSGENRFNHYFHLDGRRYFAIFGSSGSRRFAIRLLVGSTPVLNSDFPVSNFPIEITRFLNDGHNNFLVSNDNPDDQVAFAVLPLEHLSDLDIEVDIMRRKPYLTGGSLSYCPISHKLVDIPVRGMSCAHTGNVDLISYVRQSELCRIWNCPICGQPMGYDELYLDATAYNEVREFVLKDPIAFLRVLPPVSDL